MKINHSFQINSLLKMISPHFLENYFAEVKIKIIRQKKRKKYKLYKQIQDPGLNTLAEAFFKHIYIVELIWDKVPTMVEIAIF